MQEIQQGLNSPPNPTMGKQQETQWPQQQPTMETMDTIKETKYRLKSALPSKKQFVEPAYNNQTHT